jgi:hypothetical protein
MQAKCQRCLCSRDPWQIEQAEFTVGAVQDWKWQLCRDCTASIEQAIIEALNQHIDLRRVSVAAPEASPQETPK